MEKAWEMCTASELQDHFLRGDATAREILLACLRRIAQVDSAPDGCNAVSMINPDALFLADAVDAAREAGEVPGLLAGVPILIKANIGTGDKMPTTAGSEALRDHYARRDAFVVEKLRAAGAVLLGKTNMTEFANFMAYGMPGGYSSLGGQVVNYSNPFAGVGGSSSGAAAAMAENLAGACIGTETNGSILWPAQASGTVGLKPSLGLISRRGILPICTSLDTAGPITKSVADAALLMNVMAGYDPEDPATAPLQHKATEDFSRYLQPDYLAGRRIGICRTPIGQPDAEQQAAAEQLLRLMTQAGAVPVEGCDVPEGEYVQIVEMREFRCCLNAYFAQESRMPTTLAEVLEYNTRHAASALRYGQARMAEAEFRNTGRMVEADYLAGLQDQQRLRQLLTGLMEARRLDALMFTGGLSNLPPFTGFPAMTIPIGRRTDHSPIGCCIMARRYDDARLLGICYALEQLVQYR